MAYQRKNYKSRKPAEPEMTWDRYKPLGYPPNEQQDEILAAAKTGKSGRVLALAGTGKTSTLRLIGEDNPERKFLYLTLNRPVADAAAKVFPPNVKCINYHRIAFRAFADQASRRNGKYPSADYVATVLNARPFTFTNDNGDSVTVDTEQIGMTIKESVGNFTQSDDRRVTGWHVKTTPQARRIPEAHRDEFVAHVLPYVQAAWSDIADPNGSLPYMPSRGDGCYVKLWSLSDPKLYGYDAILYDEAQDANPPVAHVVSIQSFQKIYVGDSNQAIYGFTGAIDALKRFESDWTLPLTRSYRFGPAIADAGNAVLKHVPDNDLTLEGHEPIESEVASLSDPDCILCRTNAGVIESALSMVEAGLNVAIAGGTKEIENFAIEAEKLISPDAAYRRHTDKMREQGKNAAPREKYLKVKHPLLNSFHSWEQIQAAVEEGDASDVAMMVRLIDKYSVQVIFDVCKNSSKLREGIDPAEWASQPGNVMVSTAHKAKGLEWNTVRIGNDFQPPKEGKTLAVAELMLIYVAVTRAKLRLDKSSLAWLDDLADETLNGAEGLGEI